MRVRGHILPPTHTPTPNPTFAYHCGYSLRGCTFALDASEAGEKLGKLATVPPYFVVGRVSARASLFSFASLRCRSVLLPSNVTKQVPAPGKRISDRSLLLESIALVQTLGEKLTASGLRPVLIRNGKRAHGKVT